MDFESPIPRADLLAMISDQIPEVYPDYGIKKTEALAARVLEDLYILARCAISNCRVTYTDAIILRGYGNRQNGRWLDDVYGFAISPLGFPDLTMLVVNAATGQPSEDAFEARRSKLSEIQISEIPREQNRCIWFDAYEAVLGPLEPVPTEYHYARSVMPEPPLEAEIRRAVSNAIQRVKGRFGEAATQRDRSPRMASVGGSCIARVFWRFLRWISSVPSSVRPVRAVVCRWP